MTVIAANGQGVPDSHHGYVYYNENIDDPSIEGLDVASPAIFFSVGQAKYIKIGPNPTDWALFDEVVELVTVMNDMWEAKFSVALGNLNYYYAAISADGSGLWDIKRIRKSNYRIDRSWTEEGFAPGTYEYGSAPYGESPYGGSEPTEWINETIHGFGA